MKLAIVIAAAALLLASCATSADPAQRQAAAARMMAFGAILSGAGAQAAAPLQTEGLSPAPTACFLRGQYVSGFYRTCVYSCMGGATSRMVGAAELCPIS